MTYTNPGPIARTNRKIEAFWDILQAEFLDRERFTSMAAGEQALARFAEYYNYHRIGGVLGWITLAERYDGTPFTERGFQNIYSTMRSSTRPHAGLVRCKRPSPGRSCVLRRNQ